MVPEGVASIIDSSIIPKFVPRKSESLEYLCLEKTLIIKGHKKRLIIPSAHVCVSPEEVTSTHSPTVPSFLVKVALETSPRWTSPDIKAKPGGFSVRNKSKRRCFSTGK